MFGNAKFDIKIFDLRINNIYIIFKWGINYCASIQKLFEFSYISFSVDHCWMKWYNRNNKGEMDKLSLNHFKDNDFSVLKSFRIDPKIEMINKNGSAYHRIRSGWENVHYQ